MWSRKFRSVIGITLAVYALASCFNDETSPSNSGEPINPELLAAQPIPATPEQVRQLTTSANALASGLLSRGAMYQSLASDAPLPDGVAAPYDATRLLGMLAVGARGDTLGELQRTLAFDAEPATWPNVFYTLNAALQPSAQDAGNGSVKTAAAWLGQEQYAFDQHYLDTLFAAYRTEHSLWNFADLNPHFSVPLQAWVQTHTGAQLTEWLYTDAPTRARVVQSSATNISAEWNTQSYEVSEFSGLFDRMDGTQIRLPMLRIKGMLSIAEHGDFSVVKLPLAISEWELLLVTPKPGRFEEVERGLVAMLPPDDSWTPTSSLVVLPMFAFRSNYNLKNYLQGRGLNLAFQEHAGAYPQRADFSGINNQGYAYLAEMAGGASMSVSATGLRIAGSASALLAATRDEPASVWSPISAGVVLTQRPPCTLVYIKAGEADATPFLVIVRHTATGTILSVGRAVRLSGEDAGRWECPPLTYVVNPLPIIPSNASSASVTLTSLTKHR